MTHFWTYSCFVDFVPETQGWNEQVGCEGVEGGEKGRSQGCQGFCRELTPRKRHGSTLNYESKEGDQEREPDEGRGTPVADRS